MSVGGGGVGGGAGDSAVRASAASAASSLSVGSAERERSGSRRYEMLEKLGAGTYGMVYKAREVATGAIVAIKRIIPDKNDQGIPSTTLREVSALRSVQHENIVRLLDVHFASDNLELVFEYVEQDLYKYLKGFPDGLPPAEVRVRIAHSRRAALGARCAFAAAAG